ncbi:hypothetical protein BANRA_01377 [Klebsiella variicola]|nr:hypothetical protein BANRA_01377 [Klebsiella variicola]
MTERVYYTSDATDGRAQIIACTAEADGRYAIELDRTLFHPQEAVNLQTAAGSPGRRLRRLLCAATACCISCRKRFPSVTWR